MRKLFWILPLLCSLGFGQTSLGGKATIGGQSALGNATSGGTTFTKTQIVAYFGASGATFCPNTGTTCAITVSSTCFTCVGIIIAAAGQASTFISSVSGGGTWVTTASNYYTGGVMSMSGAYVLSETGSVTTYTITFGATLTVHPELFYIEYSWTGTTPAFNTSLAENNGGGSGGATTIPGVALTLGGSQSVIVQAQAYGTPTSISGGSPTYGNFQSPAPLTSLTIADSENTTSGTAPTWNYSGSSFANTVGIAIK